jgi:hypothetical protein
MVLNMPYMLSLRAAGFENFKEEFKTKLNKMDNLGYNKIM